MKQILTTILVIIFSISVSAQEVITKIEYDGVYAEISTGQYIKLTENRAFAGRYIDGGWSNMKKYLIPDIYFTDQNNVINLPTLKKIIFKGADFKAESMRLLSIHPGEDVSKTWIQCNDRSVNWNNNARFYLPKRPHKDSERFLGTNFIMNQKSQYLWDITIEDNIAINENTIMWIGNKFWIFNMQKQFIATKRKKTHSKLPAHEGVFVKMKNSTYLELDTTVYDSGHFFYFAQMGCGGECFRTANGSNINPSALARSHYYLSERFDLQKNKVAKTQFVEIIIKGASFDIEKFKLYKVDKIEVARENKCVLWHYEDKVNYVTDWKDKTIYKYGKQIKCLRKTNDNNFVFEQEQALEVGIYTVCTGEECYQIIID